MMVGMIGTAQKGPPRAEITRQMRVK